MDEFTLKSKKDLSNPNSIIFSAVLDDRGRVIIPAKIRNKFNLRFNSQVLLEFKKKINGCDSITDIISAYGADGVSSNPTRNPKGDKNER
ncbi:MAG: AbrB/MazE/SpoVT family DNA-binding domain-containing protein [Candidatus Aenigmatarchaeota archaeon]